MLVLVSTGFYSISRQSGYDILNVQKWFNEPGIIIIVVQLCFISYVSYTHIDLNLAIGINMFLWVIWVEWNNFNDIWKICIPNLLILIMPLLRLIWLLNFMIFGSKMKHIGGKDLECNGYKKEIEIYNFFQDLYRAKPLCGCDQILTLISSLVSPELNQTLLTPLFDEEIKTTIFQLGANKASDPDWFSNLFY